MDNQISNKKPNVNRNFSVAKARKIIGESGKKYTDQEIEEVTSIFIVMADLAIDSYLENRGKNIEIK